MKALKHVTLALTCAIALAGASVQVYAADEADAGVAEKSEKSLAPKARTQPSRTAKPLARKAAVKPATRKASAKGTKIPAAANAIVQELRREFELGKLRKTSDYLTEKPNAEMTADVITVMLQRRLGSNGPMDAYIKWQLLSGLGTVVPDQSVGEAIAAYMEAPGLEIRPGMTDNDKRELDREIKRTDDPAELNSRLVDDGRRIDILNEPVLAYRDKLFGMLPSSPDTFRAALKDIYDRGSAGVTPRAQTTRVGDRITKWAADADPADAQVVLDVLDELISLQMPDYYDTPRFNEADRKYVWTARRADINDGKRLDDAAVALERRIGNQGGNAQDQNDQNRPANRGRSKAPKSR